jgi:CRP/FNR family transcriptional regulator, cyclic AMP receptor protein
MATNARHYPQPTEDALSLLTVKRPERYPRGQIIYSEFQPPKHLHLVICGKVKVLHRPRERRPVLIDIYGPDEVFGECALLDMDHCSEEAAALENTEVMKWTSSEIADLIASRPKLGVALLQTMTRRALDCGIRLRNTLGEKTGERLLLSLVGLSERLGTPGVAGWVRIAPLSHQILAQYNGTSREIVTHYMNRFRRQGLLEYSRKEIVLREAAFEIAVNSRRAAPQTSAGH